MTRVSLKEAYDNKDVIAQIYAIRDTAESAVDTSEQAVTTANTASDHVDALVPQVEGAVENANSASASAQASAQTVAGYENRLASVEDATEDLAGDLNAVTLRVTTAEGDILTIQGRVTALETADGQNVKINAINNYAVGLTDNQDVYGNKTWHGHDVNKMSSFEVPSTMPRMNGTGWVKMYETNDSNHINAIFTIHPRRANNTPGFGIIACGAHNNGTVICKWLSKDLITAGYINGIMITVEDTHVTIWAKNISGTDTANMRMISCCYNGDLLVTYSGFTEATDHNIYEMNESEGVIQGYTDSDDVTHVFNYYQISS